MFVFTPVSISTAAVASSMSYGEGKNYSVKESFWENKGKKYQDLCFAKQGSSKAKKLALANTEIISIYFRK
jgi:hypothetical protein